MRRTTSQPRSVVVAPRVRRTTASLPRQRVASPEVTVAVPKPRPAPASAVEPPATDTAPQPKARRESLPRLWRVFTGLALIAAAVASVSLMVVVMTEHLGFSPVLSASMVPTFRPGDLVITKPEPAADIKVGQVVELPVPDSPGQHYVHRIISVGFHDGLPLVRTKGDANSAPEPFALQINSPKVPRVIAVVPYLGRLSVVLQRSTIRIGLLVITVGAMLLAALRLLGFGQPRRRPKHG